MERHRLLKNAASAEGKGKVETNRMQNDKIERFSMHAAVMRYETVRFDGTRRHPWKTFLFYPLFYGRWKPGIRKDVVGFFVYADRAFAQATLIPFLCFFLKARSLSLSVKLFSLSSVICLQIIIFIFAIDFLGGFREIYPTKLRTI